MGLEKISDPEVKKLLYGRSFKFVFDEKQPVNMIEMVDSDTGESVELWAELFSDIPTICVATPE